MELLAPGGNLQKLRYAFQYGADAVYIGLPLFSLRAKADNLEDQEETPELLAQAKGDKKVYGALNIYFHNPDLGLLKAQLEKIKPYPFDAFIISDLGVLPLLQEYFPDREFHLSTQANCTNWSAAKMYYSMGFSRIVPGRELSLVEIAEIKQRVPELELETFVHGAMCMSYSGRCFLSAETSQRSANRGDCAHNCRWTYRTLLEEETRPGQFYQVETGPTPSGAYTAILSSKDLCMVDHIDALKAVGVDSVKIEGRMKSLYYTAVVTRAYRWAIDHGSVKENPYRIDLFEVSHREYDTGFYFDRAASNVAGTEQGYYRSHLFLGTIEDPPSQVIMPALNQELLDKGLQHLAWVQVKNSFTEDQSFEILDPTFPHRTIEPGSFKLFDSKGIQIQRLSSEKPGWIVIDHPLPQGSILRKPIAPNP